MKVVTMSAVALLALAPVAASAHPGGLNAEGCHNDRKNGGYHCHRGSGGGSSRSTPPSQARGLVGSGSSSGGAFRNCAEARAAGKAPVRRGQPGYGPHLDRDGDGVGCERG
ncbi:excalibur calcium-binding domain-containing protein [Brevundimonas diminuta]|uniref:excalibur calcium-binding domain-containing protein n=1 Tax=Brevundimonas diminuta TaxID=293 RepID=UPI00397A4AED